MKRLFYCCAFLLALTVSSFAQKKTKAGSATKDAILVFSKTKGFRHASIPKGKAALLLLGQQNKFAVDTTENASVFTAENLKKYKAVVFLSTTGDVLDDTQQAAFEQYIRQGGGYVGIHAAADTEYNWPWYNQLVGAYFLSHPKQQSVDVVVNSKEHPSTSMLPDRWKRFDELYNYKKIVLGIKVLATLDDSCCVCALSDGRLNLHLT